MAYKVLYQDSRDLDKRKAIGVSMPFDSDTVFVPTYNSLEAYKVNLYNFFMTGRGERYLNPELGNILHRYLFTSIPDQQTVRSIQETIQREVEKFFPRLEIIQTQVEDFPDENMVQVSVRFKIRGTEPEDTLILDINR